MIIITEKEEALIRDAFPSAYIAKTKKKTYCVEDTNVINFLKRLRAGKLSGVE